MSNYAEDIGYIKASLENNSKSIDKLVAAFEEHSASDKIAKQEIKEDIQELKDEVSLYKTAIKFLKVSIAAILVLTTMSFGDIVKLIFK